MTTWDWAGVVFMVFGITMCVLTADLNRTLDRADAIVDGVAKLERHK